MTSRFLSSSAILFFLVTSFFAVTWRGGHFNSPDETANAFFIRQYVQTGSFRVAEPFNVVAENIIHPRAVAITEHDLVPGSFLGMLLLYGWIAKIFGLWTVPFLTSLFALGAAFAFRSIITRIFDDRIARWSFILFLFHPALLYYTGRSLFPNVLFLSLLCIGVALLLSARTHWRWFFGSLVIGLALTVRTAEVGWMFAVAMLLWYFYRREITWRRVALSLCAVAIAFLPIFLHNNSLYGNPFYNGYSQIDSDALPAVFAWHLQSRFLSTLLSLLLPFGIKPAVVLGNAYAYGIWFFWWMAVPTILGLVLYVRVFQSKREPRAIFTVCFLLTAVWLFVYYGSWEFRDTTLLGPTIGTSYVRYWLPLFIFGIPYAAYALQSIKNDMMRRGAVAILFSLSFTVVFLQTPESLLPLYRTAQTDRAVTQSVLQKTDAAGVILTERSDKLFFPDRHVLFNDPLDQKKIDRVVALLADRMPVYYFTELEKHDIDFINERRLASYGVAWSGGEEIGGQRLYRL
ncbi:hypothetical protein HY625_03345, partial [Candidatus Uhrbacteria bacterium]|nr:hypothetical protein [Candidatus Uhrbacteria bacterium]